MSELFDLDVAATRSGEKPTAFLVIPLGGTGNAATANIRRQYDMDRQPFPMTIAAVDTDSLPTQGGDFQIRIGLDGQKAKAIIANAGVFGPKAEAIVRDFGALLHPENIQNGARTTRALTQLALLYHEELVIKQLRDAVLHLFHQGGFKHIIPVMLASSGGGTGSALSILLPQKLAESRFKARLTEGLPSGVVQTPILFVVEPFAYAMRNQTLHADKILANAFAFRLESALLEIAGALRYCFHLGLASPGGTVLDSPDQIARVLGTSVYQFLYHWPQIKSRLVDTVDTHMLSARYAGQDIWERVQRLFAPASGANSSESSKSVKAANERPSANGSVPSGHNGTAP